VSRVSGWYRIWMSHINLNHFVSEPQLSYQYVSHVTCEWVILHMSETCHFAPHVPDLTYQYVSHVEFEWVIYHIWMTHVKFQWVTYHTWMRHVKFEWVMYHIQMSHVGQHHLWVIPHMSESCTHTHTHTHGHSAFPVLDIRKSLIDAWHINDSSVWHMGWLRLVGSLKLQVSFAEYSLLDRALL